MKKNSWKALILAAYTFLFAGIYAAKNDTTKEDIIHKVTSITTPNDRLNTNNKSYDIIELVDNLTERQTIYVKANKTLDEIARETIDGVYGNGNDRKVNLENLGYDYYEVQSRVNEILKEEYNLEQTTNTTVENVENSQVTVEPANNQVVYYELAYINSNTTIVDELGNEIIPIDAYQKVFITSKNGYYTKISTTNGYEGYVYSDCLTSIPNTHVEIDISDQKLYMYYENELVLDCNVITGNPNVGTNPGTDIGYHQVLDKQYCTELNGPTWSNCYVDIFILFNYSGEGCHDADAWRGDWEYDVKDRYQTNGSHGCVNMKQEDVEILDQYTQIGTPILIHE